MKILYIASNFGLVSETFITDLVKGLSQNNSVTVLCNSNSSTSENSRQLLCELLSLKFLSLSSVFDRFLYRLNSIGGIKGSLRNYQLRLKNAYFSILPSLHRCQPDVVYIDYGTVAVMVRRALVDLKVPFVVHFHGADISSALNNDFYRQELARVFEDASFLIVASHHIRRLLILEGAAADKIKVVHCGLNLEGLAPLSWEERKKMLPSVVFLGRLTPKKHPVALVEAFALVKQQISKARLSMIGDGPEMTRVQQRIECLGLQDSIKLHGALPRHEALPIVNCHWVFAQHSVTAPSGDQEGFGISLAEAAALGLPIVSTLHNGIPEQVIHGKTGFLGREFDYETMADYIIKLLLNVDLAAAMGANSHANIYQICPASQRVKKIEEILEIVANL